MNGQALQPRTEKERAAWLDGYACATENIAKHGVQFAADYLKLQVQIAEEKAERAKGGKL